MMHYIYYITYYILYMILCKNNAQKYFIKNDILFI